VLEHLVEHLKSNVPEFQVSLEMSDPNLQYIAESDKRK